MKYTRRSGRRRGGFLPGNASVAIQQDPLSPTILVSRDMANNIFEERNTRITGGSRKRRTMRRKHPRRRTQKN